LHGPSKRADESAEHAKAKVKLWRDYIPITWANNTERFWMCAKAKVRTSEGQTTGIEAKVKVIKTLTIG